MTCKTIEVEVPEGMGGVYTGVITMLKIDVFLIRASYNGLVTVSFQEYFPFQYEIAVEDSIEYYCYLF